MPFAGAMKAIIAFRLAFYSPKEEMNERDEYLEEWPEIRVSSLNER
jgi:hypothetical protein